MKKRHLFLLLFYLITSNTQAQVPTEAWNELGIEIAKALSKHDQSVDKYFDKMAFLKRFIAPNPRNKDIKKFNRQIRSQWRIFSLGSSFAKQPNLFNYEYIGMHEDSSLVIRQWAVGGGLNYLLFKLEYINDTWIGVDLYVMMTGEFLSETMRNTLYLPTVIRLIQDGKKSRQGMSNAEIYIEASKLMQEEEYQRAYTKISGIPLTERLKAHQILKLNLSYYLDSNEKILKAIEEYKTRFPNDPSFEFIMLDKYLLEEKYEKVLRAIGTIEAFIGADDYLHYQKGLVYHLMGDLKTSETEMRKAIEQRPSEELYYWELLTILEWQKNYAKCVKVLNELQAEFAYSKAVLREKTLEGYHVFPYTRKFRRWVKQSHKKGRF
jgi:tetratricopeptide (TPR) repeat protein